MTEPTAIDAFDPSLVQELDAICASVAFRHSPQQQRFLRHIVSALREGNLAALREMALGIDVFRRPAGDFDPKKDPIVRVEARRLRERLARYYALEGERSAVEIVVPIGSYVPLVRRRAPVEAVAAHRLRKQPPWSNARDTSCGFARSRAIARRSSCTRVR